MAQQVTVTSPQTLVAGRTTTVVVQKKEPNSWRAIIPALHIAMAITCLILNIFLPGIGTIVSGFAVFCCGNPGQSGRGKFGTFCLNFWIGLLQLVLAVLMFSGWIWAIVWGVIIVDRSNDYHNPQTNTTVTTTDTLAPNRVIVTTTGVNQTPPQGYAQPLPQQGYVQPLPPQMAGQAVAYPPSFVFAATAPMEAKQTLPQQGYAQPLPPQMTSPAVAYPPGTVTTTGVPAAQQFAATAPIEAKQPPPQQGYAQPLPPQMASPAVVYPPDSTMQAQPYGNQPSNNPPPYPGN